MKIEMPPVSDITSAEPVETKKNVQISSTVAAALNKCKNLKEKKAQV
jgi:hypothetical protein